jgi:hypothetical protein
MGAEQMKLPPEADPSFWIGAKCKRVSVRHFVGGAVERRFTVVSAVGVTATVIDRDRRPNATISMQNHALTLARAKRKDGATDAMRAVLPHIARVEQQAATLRPAAEQRGMDAFRRRKARDDDRTNARRRERALGEVRRNAALLSEDEVVTAWREGGLVESLHAL